MYEVILSKKFRKSFQKLDKYTQKIVQSWIDKNLENCENPRIHGKPLTGNHKGEWRYRVGDYRLLAKIEDDKIIIIFLDIGHRSQIY